MSETSGNFPTQVRLIQLIKAIAITMTEDCGEK